MSKKCAPRVSHLIKGAHVLSKVEAEKRNKKRRTKGYERKADKVLILLIKRTRIILQLPGDFVVA